ADLLGEAGRDGDGGAVLAGAVCGQPGRRGVPAPGAGGAEPRRSAGAVRKRLAQRLGRCPSAYLRRGNQRALTLPARPPRPAAVAERTRLVAARPPYRGGGPYCIA